MLLFATKLYVKESFTDEIFIQKASEWVKNGRRYDFPDFEWNREESFSVTGNNRQQKFSINQYENTIAVRLVNKDRKIIWTNDFILAKENGKRILAVLLKNDTVDMSVKLYGKFNKPYLLKEIIREGYGDMDNEISTDNLPLMITEENISIAESLIAGVSNYIMPVAYISFSDKNYVKVDPERLADELGGIAHVFYEESGSVNRYLSEKTDRKNPYGGAVQIYYGNGITQRILPRDFADEEDYCREIVKAVCGRLTLSGIKRQYSLSRLQYNSLERKSRESMEISQICDEILDEKDSVINENNNHIQELESKISDLESRLEIYENGFFKKKKNGNTSGGVSFILTEHDLYKDEIKDIVLQLIQKEADIMSSDPNLTETRKYHVLHDIITNNPQTKEYQRIRNSIKSIMSTSNSVMKKIKQLNNLGFTATGNGHYKLKFANDDRYMFTLAKTASDYRADVNAAFSAINKIFGRE